MPRSRSGVGTRGLHPDDQALPISFTRIRKPEAYLRRISVNVVREWGQAQSRARARGDIRAPEIEQQVDQISALETRDTLRRLERAVAKLKPKTRTIFLAHRLDGLSYADIAKLTGLSVKGVEKQMSKAIATIDRLLDRR
jgi:RNA polymerase sigma factor (sigma-70 family)